MSYSGLLTDLCALYFIYINLYYNVTGASITNKAKCPPSYREYNSEIAQKSWNV